MSSKPPGEVGSAWFSGLEVAPGVGSAWFSGLEVAPGVGSAGGNVLTCRGRSLGGPAGYSGPSGDRACKGAGVRESSRIMSLEDRQIEVSIARLPATSRELFGREAELG